MSANSSYHHPYTSHTVQPGFHHQGEQPYSPRSPSPSLHQASPVESEPYSKSVGDDSYATYGRTGRLAAHSDTILHSKDNIALQTHNPKSDVPKPFFDRQPSDTVPLNPQPRSSRHKKGKFDWSRIPWVVYTLSMIQVIVFIAELVKMSTLTGSPIETKPSFNPMIGPSPYLQINMGARYVPCMRNQAGVQDTTTPPIQWPCPNATSATGTCTLSQLCGLSRIPDSYVDPKDPNSNLNTLPAPHQWYRFITPIFLHAGFIHITGNLLLQLTIGRDMEKAIGSIRLALVYFSSGIWGFVLGGNFAAPGVAATGCSGSLFGIIGLVFLDLLYTWSSRRHPGWDLLFLFVVVVIMVVLGLLPTGLDNFSHIGGLLMGLVLGVCILHSPNALRKHTDDETAILQHGNPRYQRRSQPISSDELIYGTTGTSAAMIFKNPVGFFKGRKPLWWVWWGFRAGALVAVLIGFIVMLNNFYSTHSSNCSWCKYLSCIDVKDWCSRGQLNTSPSPTSSMGPEPTSLPTARGLLL